LAATLTQLVRLVISGDSSGGQAALGGLSTKAQRTQRQMSEYGTRMTLGFTVPIVAGFTMATKGASDLEEAVNKSDVVFGKNAKTIHTWSATASDSFGQSQEQAESAASTFGNLFKTMGMGSKPTAQMSQEMVELAADLASFHNISIEEALQKLQSGLVGEAEPMRQLGVLLNETTVKQEAYRMGLADVGDELTEQQKVQARYSLIMTQTKDAQGDYARTSDSLANKTRELKAKFADISAQLGTSLIPIAKDLAKVVEKVAGWFSGLSETQRKWLLILGGAVAAAGPLMKFSSLLMGLYGAGVKGAKGIKAVVVWIRRMATAQSAQSFTNMWASETGTWSMVGKGSAGKAKGLKAVAGGIRAVGIASRMWLPAIAGVVAALAGLAAITPDTVMDYKAAGTSGSAGGGKTPGLTKNTQKRVSETRQTLINIKVKDDELKEAERLRKKFRKGVVDLNGLRPKPKVEIKGSDGRKSVTQEAEDARSAIKTALQKSIGIGVNISFGTGAGAPDFGGMAGAAGGMRAAAIARQFIGSPYVIGGTTPAGWDCSGFMKYVYNAAGLKGFPTYTGNQWPLGRRVANNAIRAGDQLFFRTGIPQWTDQFGWGHTGIYLGGGLYAHASGRRTGTIISSLASTRYPWAARRHFAAAGADFLTQGPTLLLAGERGREHVKVTPAPRMGVRGGDGVSVYLEVQGNVIGADLRQIVAGGVADALDGEGLQAISHARA